MLFLDANNCANSVIWRAQTLVKRVTWFIWILSSITFAPERETQTNAYSIRSGAKITLSTPFSANTSLRVFSKTWQYYFNAKRRFVLVQAFSKTGPKKLKTPCPALKACHSVVIAIPISLSFSIICFTVSYNVLIRLQFINMKSSNQMFEISPTVA